MSERKKHFRRKHDKLKVIQYKEMNTGKREKMEWEYENIYITPAKAKAAGYLIDLRSHWLLHFTIFNHSEGPTSATLDKHPDFLLRIRLVK